MKSYNCYLFVYFTGEYHEDGEQIYFAISRDGLHYTELNQNQPILTSNLGEKGVRDPFILRSELDQKFYILSTDLCIYKSRDWWKAQTQGSRSIIIWESDDLIHWSEPRSVSVARHDAGCAWAPEAIYDKEMGEYLVYWASRIQEDGFAKHRIYYSWTKDFIHFTEPQVYIEREKDIIDTTIIEHDGIYYRFSKDEVNKNILCDKSKHLLGEFTPHSIPLVENQKGVEGPQIYRLSGVNRWCLLLDAYGGQGYYPLICNDLASGDFRVLSPDEYRMPKGARHGSVLSITNQEYESLLLKWG